MKNYLLALLSFGLCTCASEVAEKRLTFNGHIMQGDVVPSVPLANVWIKIRLYGEALSLISADSMKTDVNGNYSFVFPDTESVKQYSVLLRDEYYFKCTSFILPELNDFILPDDIDRSTAISDTISACVTGKIKLRFTKLNTPAKDTLFVAPKVKLSPSITLIEYPTTVFEEMEMVSCYFAKSVVSIEYHFQLKKESGEITTWTVSKDLEAQTTQQLDISF